ncbi:hypothetical protein K466DRAFT_518023 [Polyporus arcularius HHB13444]|uniref:BTB domain-containing protein n=1 Tax=Polyporus arcularius HHB13444 TaxID=1314778 RepID=A0A5C3PNU7_9APHY|nr:hypothetical protein K466DRAFT_518023 [Polyporus arcularius HHB13444]
MSLAAEGKRSRTPETSDSAAEFAKKKKTPCRGEVWFDDGNLIITTGDTMFKLYKGLLAAQSPVFAGMFAVADSNSGPLSGDTSQVELHDSPEDMTHLLRALLPRMNVSKQENSGKKTYTFAQLSALVRLAHKYEIDDIQNEALSVLKTQFAYDLKNPWLCDGEKAFNMPNPACAIEVIHLARLTDTPALLPFAFYMCATIGGKTAEGWRREDGTTVYLSQEDLKRFIDGSMRLARKAGELVSSIADIILGAGARCTPACRDQCHTSLTAIHQGFLAARGDEIPDTPFFWLDTITDLYKQHPCCAPSTASFLSGTMVRCGVSLWFTLPGIFGLPADEMNRLLAMLP